MCPPFCYRSLGHQNGDHIARKKVDSEINIHSLSLYGIGEIAREKKKGFVRL